MQNFNHLWNSEDYVKRYNQLYHLAESECSIYSELLNLQENDHLVDLGCGRGDYLKTIITKVRYLSAVDTSKWQLEELHQELGSPPHLQLFPTDFFTFAKNLKQTPPYPLFTKALARASLHHLTYDEKRIFFRTLSSSFNQNSLFLLHDMVFEFPKSELLTRWEELIPEAKIYYGEKWEAKREDILATWRDEYPEDLVSWCSLFQEGGFTLIKRIRVTSFISLLVMTKGSSVEAR